MRKLLIASLAALVVSACARPGDFCDVYLPTSFQDRDTALQVVALDRAAAESMAANQDAWARCP